MPPSVPISTSFGPRLAGSGTPPSRPSVGQVAGNPVVLAAATIGTSPALASLRVPSAFHIGAFDLA